MSALGLELQGLYDCARLAGALHIPEPEAAAIMREVNEDASVIHADDLTLALYSWVEYTMGAPIVATIYIARGVGDGVLYVGITGKNIRRLHAHSKAATWWELAASVSLEHFCDREAAEARERQLIRQLDPPYNTTHRVAR